MGVAQGVMVVMVELGVEVMWVVVSILSGGLVASVARMEIKRVVGGGGKHAARFKEWGQGNLHQAHLAPDGKLANGGSCLHEK